MVSETFDVAARVEREAKTHLEQDDLAPATGILNGIFIASCFWTLGVLTVLFLT